MPNPQERVEIKGSTRSAFPHAKDLGPAAPNEQMEVTLLLRRPPNPAVESAHAQATTLPLRQRKYLSRKQFAALNRAALADLKLVRTFAADFHLTIVHEDRATRTVKLSGTVRNFNEAFATDLRRVEHKLGHFRCRTGTLSIPSEFDPIIEGVFGLDNRPQAKPHFRLRKPSVHPHAADVSYTPLQVAQAYAFPSSTGSGQCIGIIELGGGYNPSQLDSFFSDLGITPPTIVAVSVDGATNSPTGDPSGPDGEVQLDIEVAGSVAPGARIAVYFVPNTSQGFIDAVTTAVNDSTNKPSILSISWGGPENSWTAQSRNALNSACQDAATMGITVLVASGDDGATDGSSTGTPEVDFPASSPYTTGCGGTKLTLSGTTIASEQVWNELSSNEGATGGGVSEFFALPSFQQSANVPKAPNGFVGRGVPDVAGDADPTTGYSVLVDGQQTVIGGTSAVAPLWAGLIARLNQSLKKNLGYVNPLLYPANVESTFHDITTGNNDGYSAGLGWDPCTGLGSPNGAALLSALRSS